MILLPLMVFFFLKDKAIILSWLANFLPEERRLLRTVWVELDVKIASYVRGKVIEVLIIWVASYVAFALMGLDYAMLLSLAVGLSVIIPYVGATVVTIPVALIAFFQWGASSEFGWLMPRWQPAGASAVFGGGQSAPGCDHCRGRVFRQPVGRLGRVFRNSAGNPDTGHTQGLAIRGPDCRIKYKAVYITALYFIRHPGSCAATIRDLKKPPWCPFSAPSFSFEIRLKRYTSPLYDLFGIPEVA
jgi:hypothetical protein